LKRSILSLTLSCVIVAASFSQLGRVAEAQDRTEIQFWHAMKGQLGEALGELVNKFNQSQGEFEVKAVYKGTYQEVLHAALSAYRQKKDPPHIVQLSDVSTQRMLLSDAIVPVYRLMRQQKMEVNMADFIGTVSDYYSRDGKLYSMPFNASTPILYYNKAIFRKAGLGDKPPVTWQEVEAASRKIISTGAAKCGFTAQGLSWTMIENTFPWHDQPLATNQNGYTGLDTKLLINSDFGLMHVGALVRWQKENIFSPASREKTMDQFINNDCAMLVQTSAGIEEFKKSLTFDWGTGQLPHWGQPYPKANTSLGGASLWVLRGHESVYDRGVAQFLKFLMEPAQRRWALNATGWLPITKAGLKGLEEESFYKENPEKWTGVSQLMNAKPTPNSRGLRLGNFIDVREAIEVELENIFTGKKTVKQGLDAAVVRGNAILKQFRVNHSAAAQGEI
jgi:sn-glycerol 3-phosphate transport system substrate-binding protein